MATADQKNPDTRPHDDNPVRLAKPERCYGCGAMIIRVPCQFCEAKRADELGRQRRKLERRLADPFDQEVRAAMERVSHLAGEEPEEAEAKKRPRAK